MDTLTIVLAVSAAAMSQFSYSFQRITLGMARSIKDELTLSIPDVQLIVTPFWMGVMWWLSLAIAILAAVRIWTVSPYATLGWLAFYFLGLNLLPVLPLRRVFLRLAVNELKRPRAMNAEALTAKFRLILMYSSAD